MSLSLSSTCLKQPVVLSLYCNVQYDIILFFSVWKIKISRIGSVSCRLNIFSSATTAVAFWIVFVVPWHSFVLHFNVEFALEPFRTAVVVLYDERNITFSNRIS